MIHTLDLNRSERISRVLHRDWKHKKERKVISNYGKHGVREEVLVGGKKKKLVECWWTFEHFYMPEGIPLTTLIKVIIGAIGACQMPSLPSQLPRSPWTQLHTSSWGLGGRRAVRLRWGRGISSGGGRVGEATLWAYGTRPPSLSVSVCRGRPHISLIIIAYCCHVRLKKNNH